MASQLLGNSQVTLLCPIKPNLIPISFLYKRFKRGGGNWFPCISPPASGQQLDVAGWGCVHELVLPTSAGGLAGELLEQQLSWVRVQLCPPAPRCSALPSVGLTVLRVPELCAGSILSMGLASRPFILEFNALIRLCSLLNGHLGAVIQHAWFRNLLWSQVRKILAC